jgi:hypothetical protein
LEVSTKFSFFYTRYDLFQGNKNSPLIREIFTFFAVNQIFAQANAKNIGKHFFRNVLRYLTLIEKQ